MLYPLKTGTWGSSVAHESASALSLQLPIGRDAYCKDIFQLRTTYKTSSVVL